jgi:predicted dehydrogenase
VTVEYAGGSVATVHYSSVGSAAMPKERVEVMSGGRSWVLEDFVALTSFAGSQPPREASERPVDKGHAELIRRVLRACRGESPFEPGIGAAYAAQSIALAALESIAAGAPVRVSIPST